MVYGLGGVGLAAVMGALAAGAQPVIGVDPVAAKRALALAFDPAEAHDGIMAATAAGRRW